MRRVEPRPKLHIVQEGEQAAPGIHHEAVYTALAQLVTFEMVDDPAVMREAINDLYVELSLGDELLVQELGALEEAGAIFREDKMYLFVLFSVAGAHGLADVTHLRDEIVSRRIDPAAIAAKMQSLPLPEPLKKYLSTGVSRIHASYTKKKWGS